MDILIAIALGLGIIGFCIGFVVLRITQGAALARVAVGVLAAGCFIATRIFWQSANNTHGEAWGFLMPFLEGVAIAIVGFGLAASTLSNRRSAPEQT